eukprot:264536-Pyramimonas_sp.AAC.1
MAEQFVFYMAVWLMGPRATTITDHKNPLICLQKGPEKMSSFSEPYWEVWRLVLGKVNDVRSDNVNLQRELSLESSTVLQNHDFSDSRYHGNRQAEKYSRLGALVHPVASQLDQRVQAALVFGRQFKWLLAGSLRHL